ncbi:efflux transporter, outer membrane factor (OMF) lipoprotein, NodT family [Sphingomonas sp. YR710]|uniref:efflux transporter outer membrane subunit n=1 Tax=Sphingomonas sp. YR710 TaxID=1882773 RepID=UPI000885FC40|nr:efflux transporter outer membrane subunit [Sphingomonas sp. YR710]SDD18348.1 efflux transporter, outer membrane factor (OMF) lipoprotein, NodT family [Sphingomonas sp. YR710]
MTRSRNISRSIGDLARGAVPCLLLAGCNVGPNYHAPSTAALKVPAGFRAATDMRTGSMAAEPVDLARWWQGFEDPVLTGLVDRAFAANLDIDAAGARLRQARATVRGTLGTALPSASTGGSVNRTIGNQSSTFIDPTSGQATTSGGDRTIYSGSFDVAWEADIFGGIRRSIQATRASAESTEATLHFTQLSVASEVGLNYMAARLAQIRLRIARENLASQDETLQIVGWRRDAGLVSSLDYEQARQLRAQTAASIPTIENTYMTAVNRIAVLLGEAPGAVTALIDPPASIPLAPGIAAPIPAEVIARRPDVAASERALAAEVARIGVQKAQLYPALRLTGSFSGSASSVGNVISDGVGALAAAISAPIFEGGQIRAAIAGQRASTDAALAGYRSTVLEALEEVENALKARDVAERRERDIAISAEAAGNAVRYARAQYRAGLIDFQSLLDTERALLSSQDSAASARADRATSTIQLYKALGGGWQAAPMPVPGQYEGGKPASPSPTTRP